MGARRAAADADRRALAADVERIARAGGTPLLLADGDRILGAIYLRDILKPNTRERFDRLRAMGIRTVMITGDNPLTASAIAREAGVDDFLAEATPETKMALIKREQSEGRLVAMTGDGTNDAPALAQADVGVAMNSGTQAAKEAGNMVDLDSDPTKLIEIVEVGKQLLMTRGALTTFSIANDVAKYFAILPAMFIAAYPAMDALNVMRLATPQSAILSAIIFNALDHRRADPARAARRRVPPARRGRRAARERARSTASAASSCRSSASRRSTSSSSACTSREPTDHGTHRTRRRAREHAAPPRHLGALHGRHGRRARLGLSAA